MVPINSAVEQTVVSRPVDGSSPSPARQWVQREHQKLHAQSEPRRKINGEMAALVDAIAMRLDEIRDDYMQAVDNLRREHEQAISELQTDLHLVRAELAAVHQEASVSQKLDAINERLDKM